MWGEITYPFSNFNGAVVEVWEWIFHSAFSLGVWLLIHTLKLMHISERAPETNFCDDFFVTGGCWLELFTHVTNAWQSWHIHNTNTVRCRYNSVNFLQISHNISPSGAGYYGVSVVNTNSDFCSASLIRMLYAVSCCTGPRYNGTRLYLINIALLKTLKVISSRVDVS